MGTFIERHEVWNHDQSSAAERVVAELEEQGVNVVRVSWPDQYGLLRGKSLSREAFLSALRNGIEITMAPFFFDSANAIVFNPFVTGGGFDMPELSGSPNVVMVPDPGTFRTLPWAPGTGWVLADLYMRTGQPFPFSPRHVLRHALARLGEAGFQFVAGLEVEWYLTELKDAMLDPEHLGAPGAPGSPPAVKPVGQGYSYLLEDHLDEVEDVLKALRENLVAVGLPLRTIDDEWAPSQFETTLDVLTGLDAADAMTLLRSATKQVCRRLGYHATFMCQPAVPGFYSSGWHLHMSLTDGHDQNLFTPHVPDEALSETGRHFVGGILEHAVAASVFTTPTVNGYRRRRPFSLAPDRATWGLDNRGAMVRVISSTDDPASHIENRVGEPAANPYLYMASQVLAGLDGIRSKADPGPPSDEPYTAVDRKQLPVTLMQAVDALRSDTFFRNQFDDRFVDYVIRMKESETARFLASLDGQTPAQGMPEQVTEWEHREYFRLF